MVLQAMWVPGHAARMEYPGGDTIGADSRPMLNVNGHAGTDLLGVPQGPGITFTGKAGKDNWFHFAIPTPTYFYRSDSDSGHAKVIRVLVRGFFTQRSTRLNHVHVWDGDRRVHPFENLDISGDFRALPIDRFLIPRGPHQEIHHGLGISVNITFGNENSTFAFNGAGADFDVRD